MRYNQKLCYFSKVFTNMIKNYFNAKTQRTREVRKERLKYIFKKY
jgi:hypothetical protein